MGFPLSVSVTALPPAPRYLSPMKSGETHVAVLSPAPSFSAFRNGSPTLSAPFGRSEVEDDGLHLPSALIVIVGSSSEQFQEKCAAVFRSELRKNKELERFRISVKNGNAPGLGGGEKGIPSSSTSERPKEAESVGDPFRNADEGAAIQTRLQAASAYAIAHLGMGKTEMGHPRSPALDKGLKQ